MAHRWYTLRGRSTSYAMAKPYGGNEKSLYMHRMIMCAPSGLQVDHIDHNGLNNCRANLRMVTSAQNQANRRRAHGATSRHKGVYWHSQRGKWRAQIRLDYKSIHLGLFASEDDAAMAYNAAAVKAWGSHALLNDV